MARMNPFNISKHSRIAFSFASIQVCVSWVPDERIPNCKPVLSPQRCLILVSRGATPVRVYLPFCFDWALKNDVSVWYTLAEKSVRCYMISWGEQKKRQRSILTTWTWRIAMREQRSSWVCSLYTVHHQSWVSSVNNDSFITWCNACDENWML